jgi:hypothetical protein
MLHILEAINDATELREALLHNGALSLPSGQGKLAIIASMHLSGYPTPSEAEQKRAFIEEADKLEEERRGQHQTVVKKPRCRLADLKEVLADDEVTDIILIGNGWLDRIYRDSGEHFDWRQVSQQTRKLKQGKFEQRMCGTFLPHRGNRVASSDYVELPHKLTVPLGTFAVSRLEHVIAAPNIILPTFDPPEEHFVPVFDGIGSPLEEINKLNDAFSFMPTLDLSETEVVEAA